MMTPRIHRSDKKSAGAGHAPPMPPGFASDKATLALIRRVLCPHLHQSRVQRSPALEDLLPPLTHSGAVDLQLYALIAIIIQEFVLGWYSSITHDRGFTDEIVRVLAHCIRLLEQRLRLVDIHALVLDELPALVELHIAALRTARQSLPPGAVPSEVRKIYHTLNPHPALSPLPDESNPVSIEQQNEKESLYRHFLAQGLMANLLPIEDLENICLRTLVGDMIADLILKQVVADQLCQGWYLWQCFSKLLVLVQEKRGFLKQKKDNARRNQLERYGLLSTDNDHDNDQNKGQQARFAGVGWLLLVQYLYVAYLAVRFFMTGIIRAFSNRSTRKRYAKTPSPGSAVSSEFPASITTATTPDLAEECAAHQTRPFIEYRVFGAFSQLLDIPTRMPWFGSAFSLGKHLLLDGPFGIGVADSVLDRFLHDTVQKYILTPSLLPDLLLAARMTLFPENTRPLPPPSGSPINNISNSNSNSNNNNNNNNIPTRLNVFSEHAASSAPTVASPAMDSSSQSTAASQPTNNNNNNNNSTSSSSLSSYSDAIPALRVQTIKRECASNLLSLIPADVAFAFFCPRKKSSSSSSSSSSAGAFGGDSHESRFSPKRAAETTPSVSDASSESCPAVTTTTTPDSDAPGCHAIPNNNNSNNHNNHNQHNNRLKNSSTAGTTTQGPALTEETRPKSRFTAHSSQAQTQAQAQREEQLVAAVETDLLDLFSDTYCNKHLIYSIIETVLVRLLPEMGQRNIAELMAVRGLGNNSNSDTNTNTNTESH